MLRHASLTDIPLGILPAIHANAAPSAPLLTVQGEVYTRAEFEAQANRRAHAMLATGVGRDDWVAVCLPNTVAFYATVFAVWKLGATPFILSPGLPALELGPLILQADPALIAGGEETPDVGRPFVNVENVGDGWPTDPLPPAIPRYWKAMTSGGSTGRPKVVVDHMPGRFGSFFPWGRQRHGDTVLNAGPLYHTAPFSATISALLTGGHVVEMRKFDAQAALKLLEMHRVNWVFLVPTMMQRILRLPSRLRAAYDHSHLHTMLHMAAPCPPWLKDRWIEWLGPEKIFEMYSSTERIGRTAITGKEWLRRRGSVGRAIECQMMILDKNMLECEPGQVGEIYFRPGTGPSSTYHYIGAEARRFDDYESVGDLGYADDDGYLFLVDRRVDVIISGGANIYPSEVESAIDAHADVVSSAVIGLRDEDLGQRTHAIVQITPGSRVTRNELLESLAARLARYKLPRSIELVHYPLRDGAGKIRRSALRHDREGVEQ